MDLATLHYSTTTDYTAITPNVGSLDPVQHIGSEVDVKECFSGEGSFEAGRQITPGGGGK